MNLLKKLKSLKAELSTQDEEFITDIKQAVLSKSGRSVHLIIYTICLFVLIGLIWAYFAPIDQVTVGTGKVIPSSEVKVIQSLDGGIVTNIFVHAGQMVTKNQLLLQLDHTRYKSDYEQGYDKYLTLQAEVARLTAEANKQDQILFPAEIKSHPDIVAREINLFNNRKKNLADEIALLETSYGYATKIVNMYQPLVASGAVSKLDYIRSEQSANEIKMQMAQKQDDFNNQVNTDLTTDKADLQVLTEALQSLRDKMQRTSLYSPVRGIIKKINTATIGGVITPGMDIMEIVPVEDTLLVQAKIRPNDIAFVHIGQPAVVKITAYDFSIYGGLKGKVEYISADTLEDNKMGEVTQKALPDYYLINIRTFQNYLGSQQHQLPIIPGMVASVHIETGKKTVLQYLLKPLIKAKQEALRER